MRLLLRRTIDAYADSPQAVGWLRHNLARFDEPLRVAIAGKVKAGKSTLLNALVGESIAPTDAGECTRIVTWYIDAPTPKVTMFPRSAPPRQLAISRSAGALSLRPAGHPGGAGRPARGAVALAEPAHPDPDRHPGHRLAVHATPRPGPARSWPPRTRRRQADAVIYLMRHLHATDVRFLESFYDQGVAKATPINTIAVLSRADEIGVGRLDALTSARRIARRYRADDKIRGLCQTVVAVAGLLAQTGRTMRQHEFAALTAAGRAAAGRAGRRCCCRSTGSPGPSWPSRTRDTRAALMDRFGLFGVRLATTLIRQGVTDPNQIAAELVRRSGLDELRSVLATQFAERRDLLKARSALLAIDLVLTREPRPASAPLAAEVERILAGAHEFAELRLLSTLRSGAVKLPAEVLDEAERLLGGDGGSAAARLGLDPATGPGELRSAALDAVSRWQRRAESPLSGRAVSDVARVVVRSVEGVLAGL